MRLETRRRLQVPPNSRKGGIFLAACVLHADVLGVEQCQLEVGAPLAPPQPAEHLQRFSRRGAPAVVPVRVGATDLMMMSPATSLAIHI